MSAKSQLSGRTGPRYRSGVTEDGLVSAVDEQVGAGSGVVSMDTAGVLDELGDAVVVADGTGTIVFANRAVRRLFGWETNQLVGQEVAVLVPGRLRAAHVEGLARFVSTGERRLVGGPPVRAAALRADGSEVPVELVVRALGEPGEPGLLLLATLRDVSSRVELESQALLVNLLQGAVEAARDGVLAVSPERRVLAFNRRFCELWALGADMVSTGDPNPLLGGVCLAQVAEPQLFEAAVSWGRSHPGEAQLFDVVLADGRVLVAYSAPIIGADGGYRGRVWYFHDDTARRAAEERLVAAERTQRFFLDASAVVSGSSGFADTLVSLAAVAVPTLGDLCLVDVVEDSGEIRRVAAVHADPAKQHLADQLLCFPPVPSGSHPAALAIREGRSRFSPGTTREFLRATTRDDAHRAVLEQLGFASYVTVPLLAEGAVLGAVTLVSAGSGRRFGRGDLALVEELARRAAGVVAKERRFEAQRRLAHALQSNLLPPEPADVPGLEVATRYLAATTGAEVGGDFWDVMVLAYGQVALAVGDVAGHDMAAAATMAQLRAAARTLRTSPQSVDPGELVRLLHGAYDALELERIATAVFARYDPVAGSLAVASAGHLPPLMVTPGRAWFLPVQPAPPFGAPPSRAVVYRTAWPAGAAMVLYTDGLVEDRTSGLAEGLDRLRLAAERAPSIEPQAFADHLVAALVPGDLGDDVALLVARAIPDGGGSDVTGTGCAAGR